MLHAMSQIPALLCIEGEPQFAHVWSVVWQKATEFRQKLLIKKLCLTRTIYSLRFIFFYI